MPRFKSPLMMLPVLLTLAVAYPLLDASYLVEQGIGFYRTVVLSQEIDRVRDRGRLDRETEGLFNRVAEIREFAYDELGLTRSGNFTKYTHLDRNHLVSVVSAVREDSLQRYMWDYPILGRMFYRGFYNEKNAEAEAERLRALGYDTHVRRVRAFSSLGYFSDPVYSFMSAYDDYRLANLIIHEEMHATLWLAEQNAYNEEIAVFVGDEGAARFIADKYGEASPEYRAIADTRHDRERYREWIRGIYRSLHTAYSTLDTRAGRLQAKERIFEEAREQLRQDYDSMFVTGRYRHLADRPLNNALVDASYSYAGDLSLYYELYAQFSGDLAAVVDVIRQSRLFPRAPRTHLATVLERRQVVDAREASIPAPGESLLDPPFERDPPPAAAPDEAFLGNPLLDDGEPVIPLSGETDDPATTLTPEPEPAVP